MTEQKTDRKMRKEVIGTVTSDKMDKTITVMNYRMVKHPRYGKYIKKKSVFKAHDEKNEAKVGDRVTIRSFRPLSRTKRWLFVKVLKEGKEN